VSSHMSPSIPVAVYHTPHFTHAPSRYHIHGDSRCFCP
jgi:hypothetical protein